MESKSTVNPVFAAMQRQDSANRQPAANQLQFAAQALPRFMDAPAPRATPMPLPTRQGQSQPSYMNSILFGGPGFNAAPPVTSRGNLGSPSPIVPTPSVPGGAAAPNVFDQIRNASQGASAPGGWGPGPGYDNWMGMPISGRVGVPFNPGQPTGTAPIRPPGLISNLPPAPQPSPGKGGMGGSARFQQPRPQPSPGKGGQQQPPAPGGKGGVNRQPAQPRPAPSGKGGAQQSSPGGKGGRTRPNMMDRYQAMEQQRVRPDAGRWSRDFS